MGSQTDVWYFACIVVYVRFYALKVLWNRCDPSYEAWISLCCDPNHLLGRYLRKLRFTESHLCLALSENRYLILCDASSSLNIHKNYLILLVSTIFESQNTVIMGWLSPGMLGSFSHPRLDFDEVIFAGAATLTRHADVRYVCEFGRISKDTSWSWNWVYPKYLNISTLKWGRWWESIGF